MDSIVRFKTSLCACIDTIVHKWTLNRLGREVPSEFLLQHLWMPAEAAEKAHVLARNSLYFLLLSEAKYQAGCTIT